MTIIVSIFGACSDSQSSGDSSQDDNLFLSDRILNIAHRGGGRLAPEATMLAYQNAFDIGADVLEMDLHSTSDGVIVCMHDSTVDSTTDGSGSIREMTFEHLLALDAAYHFSLDGGVTFPYRGGGVVVPSFEQVLDEFPEMYFAIELKQAQPSIVEGVVEALEVRNMTEQVVIVSGTDSVIDRVRQDDPDIFTSYALGELIEFVSLDEKGESEYRAPAQFIQPPADMVTAEFMGRVKRFDLKIHPWTVNDVAEMESLIDFEVDGIFTDDPAVLKSVLEERGLD